MSTLLSVKINISCLSVQIQRSTSVLQCFGLCLIAQNIIAVVHRAVGNGAGVLACGNSHGEIIHQILRMDVSDTDDLIAALLLDLKLMCTVKCQIDIAREIQ